MADTTTSSIPKSIRDVYSKEIIYQAQPKLRFAQFAKRRDDLSVQPGGSVKFTKYNNITKGGKLTEDVDLTEKQMTDTEVSISVDEFGNAIKVTEKAIRLSLHNVMEEAAVLLANDVAVVLDENLRDAALATTNVIYGGGKEAAADLDATSVFSTQAVKDAVEMLESNNAPKIEGQYYICIAHPHQLRQLRDDKDWVDTHKYNGVDQIYRGEVGMYEGVRFISTTQMPANSEAESLEKFGIEIETWEAVIFGENSYGWAVALDVEMRDNGTEDYGRKHGIAWYAMWGFGLIEEKNIFHVITT